MLWFPASPSVDADVQSLPGSALFSRNARSTAVLSPLPGENKWCEPHAWRETGHALPETEEGLPVYPPRGGGRARGSGTPTDFAGMQAAWPAASSVGLVDRCRLQLPLVRNEAQGPVHDRAVSAQQLFGVAIERNPEQHPQHASRFGVL